MTAEEFNKYSGKKIKIRGDEYDVVGYSSEEDSLLIIDTRGTWGWKKNQNTM